MMDYGAKGGNFKIAFNPTTRNLEFEVLVPRNTWFGIAFGPNMFNVDVLWFSAGQTAQASQHLTCSHSPELLQSQMIDRISLSEPLMFNKESCSK